MAALTTTTWSPVSTWGAKIGLVLAPEQPRHLGRQAAEDQAVGVDQVPGTLDLVGLRDVGAHEQCSSTWAAWPGRVQGGLAPGGARGAGGAPGTLGPGDQNSASQPGRQGGSPGWAR